MKKERVSHLVNIVVLKGEIYHLFTRSNHTTEVKLLFKKELPGFFYIQTVYRPVKSSVPVKYRKYCFKFGITNDWLEKRTKHYCNLTGLKHVLRFWWCFENGEIARSLETNLKKLVSYKPRNMSAGFTECFSAQDLQKVLEIVESSLEGISKDKYVSFQG